MPKRKVDFMDNLLGWQLAVLDAGLTYRQNFYDPCKWEAYDKDGIYAGAWGRFYRDGWIRTNWGFNKNYRRKL